MTKTKKKLVARPAAEKAVADFLGVPAKKLAKAQNGSEPHVIIDGNDISIPAFLRGPAPENRLSPEQIKRLTTGRRVDWAPFRQKGESQMAKIKVAITNHDVPVEALLNDKAGATSLRRFDNLAAFEDWYDPKRHRYLGGSNNDKSTVMMLEVDTFEDAPSVVSKRPTGAPKTGGSTVWANGKEFSSVLVAFTTLKLPVNKHKKFRAELKAKRTLAFVEGKRSVKFEYR